MSSNKKIIAFDLDGTLTVSKSPITKEMADLLKELIKQKIVVIISGGSFNQFKTQLLPPFDGDESFTKYLQNLILLPTSGTQRYIYDETKKDWQLVEKVSLSIDVKEKVKKLLQEIVDSGSYDLSPNPFGDFVEDRDTQITLSGVGQLAPVDAKKLWDPNQSKRRKIVAALEPNLPEVDLLINANSSIDILNKGFNKAVGINLLLNKMGMQQSELVFVGDGIFPGGNDYSTHEAGMDTVPVKGPEETALFIKNVLV